MTEGDMRQASKESTLVGGNNESVKEGSTLLIKVPATTANLGPGFDSIGLALRMFLTIEVEESVQWEVVPLSKEMEQFPKDEKHLICQVALSTGKRYGVDISPCKIKLKSDIPLARGLGSSAAAIVAGIELANEIGRLKLTGREKLLIANEYEGHLDNVGAALYGGLIVGSYNDQEIHIVKNNHLNVEAVVVIPDEELLTEASRDVLPKELSFVEAVEAGSIGNVLVASLLSGDFELAGKMMKADKYHQPYRKKLVPIFSGVEEVALANGAFGVALSGAGPTVICFCEKSRGRNLAAKLQDDFYNCTVELLQIDNNGSQVEVLSAHL